MEAEFTPDVADVLTASGWSSTQRVNPARWISAFEEQGITAPHEVRDFLSRFGGLDVKISGPGVTCAREPFEFDPLLCLGEEDRFAEWGEELGRQLFPVGELDQGRFFLGMDEHGVMYLVADWVARFGPWPEAVDALVRGLAPEEIAT